MCMSAESDVATSLKNSQEENSLPIVTKYKEDRDTKIRFLCENTLFFPYTSARNALFMYYKNRFFSSNSMKSLGTWGGITLGTTLLLSPAERSELMMLGGLFFVMGTFADLLSDVDRAGLFGSEVMNLDYFKSIEIQSHDSHSFIVFPNEARAIEILTELSEKANRKQGLFSFVMAPEEAVFEKYLLSNATSDVTLYQEDVVYREQLLKAMNRFDSELGVSLMLASAPLLFDKKAAGYAIPYFSVGAGPFVSDLKSFQDSVFFHTNYENKDYFKEIQFRQKANSAPWFWTHFLQVAIAGTHYAMTGNGFSLGIGLLGGYQMMHEPYGAALKGEL